MSEQNPYSPQSPYAPYAGQAPYAPSAGQAPYAPSAGQAPYAPSAGQAGYLQTTPQPGVAGPGYPYAPAPYLQQPMTYPGVPQVVGSTRPGAATGASVLGIISGSLGVIAAAITFIGLSALQAVTSAFGTDTSVYLIVGWIKVFAIFVTAVTLFVSGILFFKGDAARLLLGAAIAQAVLTIADPLIAMTLSDSDLGPLMLLRLLAGLGLSGTTIGLLMTKSARAWRK